MFDAQACLARYFPPAVAEGEAIRVSDGGQSMFERDAGTQAARPDWWVRQQVKLHGATWEVEMWPTPALAARLASPLPQVLLCSGAIGALLLASVCLLAQRASRQAIETNRANIALQAALDQVKTLEGLLPICCGCKRVRDDTGYWNKIDSYLCKHTRASLSHGYCPECAAKAFTDMGVDVPDQVLEQLAAKNYEQ